MMYNVTLTWSHGFIEKYEIMNPSATKLESEVGRINTLNNVVDYSITCNGETIAKKVEARKVKCGQATNMNSNKHIN